MLKVEVKTIKQHDKVDDISVSHKDIKEYLEEWR